MQYVHLHFSAHMLGFQNGARQYAHAELGRERVRDRSLNFVEVRSPAARATAFDLEGHIYYLFTQIFGRRNRHLAEKLAPFAITVPKWRVLAVLHERPGVTMNQLADFTTVDRTTLTRTLDQMVEDRLVERRDDAHDRRAVRLHLTGRGQEIFDKILPLVLDENERATQGIACTELAQFGRTLQRMVRNLDPDYDQRNATWLAGSVAPIQSNRKTKGVAS